MSVYSYYEDQAYVDLYDFFAKTKLKILLPETDKYVLWISDLDYYNT